MKAFSVIALVVTSAVVSGCAGVATSNMTYNSQMQVNAPQKAENCYDASVLLGANLDRAKDITKKVLVAVDATVTAEKPESIMAQRNRHIGVLVGSGGEELFVNWNAVAADKTFVTVATKTGFVGGAGQKAWSCQMVDEMIKMAH
jgi:hypothetical protein